jgi:hypothetical protein
LIGHRLCLFSELTKLYPEKLICQAFSATRGLRTASRWLQFWHRAQVLISPVTFCMLFSD